MGDIVSVSVYAPLAYLAVWYAARHCRHNPRGLVVLLAASTFGCGISALAFHFLHGDTLSDGMRQTAIYMALFAVFAAVRFTRFRSRARAAAAATADARGAC
jgi:uncharacterized membrane protein YfcA